MTLARIIELIELGELNDPTTDRDAMLIGLARVCDALARELQATRQELVALQESVTRLPIDKDSP